MRCRYFRQIDMSYTFWYPRALHYGSTYCLLFHVLVAWQVPCVKNANLLSCQLLSQVLSPCARCCLCNRGATVHVNVQCPALPSTFAEGLQVGAQVMLLRNLELTSNDRMLVNGSRGVITKFVAKAVRSEQAAHLNLSHVTSSHLISPHVIATPLISSPSYPGPLSSQPL